jgi:hypothetical protein
LSRLKYYYSHKNYRINILFPEAAVKRSGEIETIYLRKRREDILRRLRQGVVRKIVPSRGIKERNDLSLGPNLRWWRSGSELFMIWRFPGL